MKAVLKIIYFYRRKIIKTSSMLKVTAVLVIALLLVQKKLNSHQFGTGLNLIRVDWSSCISGHTSGDVRHQGGT